MKRNQPLLRSLVQDPVLCVDLSPPVPYLPERWRFSGSSRTSPHLFQSPGLLPIPNIYPCGWWADRVLPVPCSSFRFCPAPSGQGPSLQLLDSDSPKVKQQRKLAWRGVGRPEASMSCKVKWCSLCLWSDECNGISFLSESKVKYWKHQNLDLLGKQNVDVQTAIWTSYDQQKKKLN